MRWNCILAVLFASPSALAMDEIEIFVWSPNDVQLQPVGEYGIEYTDDKGNIHYDHPCGTIQKITVSQLPPPGHDGFVTESEEVYELGDEMEVVNRWSMPVDSWVMQVEGERIVVKYWRPRAKEEESADTERPAALSISTSGEIRTGDRLSCTRFHGQMVKRQQHVVLHTALD